MGRFEAYKGLIEYYKDADRLCRTISACEKCPLHVVFKDGEGGCDKSILSFSITNSELRDDIGKALYKMYAVSEWVDEHPEEDTNDVI